MKKLTLIIAILFGALLGNAQSDIIYPAEGGNIIFNCKINEVKNGNNVYYTKDSISDVVVAIAVTKDGTYIDLSEYVKKMNASIEPPQTTNDSLYRGHDYEYYNRLYKQSSYIKGAGIFMTLVGICAIGISYSKDISEETSKGLLVGGEIGVAVGVPLIIIGSIRTANNRRAKEMTKHKATLSYGATNDGVGFAFNF